ncbi:MAG TPA: hypothetical protein VJK08_02250 [Patescibacteria group bacterium]|nr:hypothetical protein [Patescibacteria group bacterium]
MSLSKAFIEKQKRILLSEKDKLIGAIAKLKKYPDYGEQEDDNTLELIDYENNLTLEENLATTLEKIGLALKAIENGTYGTCCKCLQFIEKGRLEMMPFAEICSKCQKKPVKN